ncbi:MAG TPA: hypothetical protein VMA73_27435 [Streptosporangiaceae bacterium]|nr:hypothetical protein [Streptosporangiaceae bacterium]
MSGRDDRWADLSSQNERVVRLTESTASSHSGAARSEWAALASQRERLVDTTDPEFRLAGSSHASSRHVSTDMRLVAGAA